MSSNAENADDLRRLFGGKHVPIKKTPNYSGNKNCPYSSSGSYSGSQMSRGTPPQGYNSSASFWNGSSSSSK